MDSESMEHRSENEIHQRLDFKVYAEIDIHGQTRKLSPISYFEYNKYIATIENRETMKALLIDHVHPALDETGRYIDEFPYDAKEVIDIILSISKFDDRNIALNVSKWKEWTNTNYYGIYSSFILKYHGIDTLLKAWEDPDIFERIIAITEIEVGFSVNDRIKKAIEHKKPIELRTEFEIMQEKELIRTNPRLRNLQNTYNQNEAEPDEIIEAKNSLISKLKEDMENPKKTFDFENDLKEEKSELNKSDMEIMNMRRK